MEEERKRIEIEGRGSGERAVELEVEKGLEAAALAKYGGETREVAEKPAASEAAAQPGEVRIAEGPRQ